MFINISPDDNEEKSTIKLMLDHNIAISNFDNYKIILEQISSKWKRYSGKIDIIDEDKIYELMGYKNKPNKIQKVSATSNRGNYFSNSVYMINGVETNELGYWTKTKFDDNSVYAINENGDNFINSKDSILGIRPVIEIDKSLAKVDNGIVDISKILKSAKRIKYNREKKKYGGQIYKQLQGFTVTNSRLVFASSNKNVPAKSLLYSYKLNNLNKLEQRTYTDIGHGNGLTYNSKTDKIMVVGPHDYTKVYQLNANTLAKETEFTPGTRYSAIGYDNNDDLYVACGDQKLYLLNTQNLSPVHQFQIHSEETTQDLEYHKGYAYYAHTYLEGNNINSQQKLSLKKYDNFIYVYDMILDKNRNPTANFGKLIHKLKISGFGELESISFRGGNIYFGFSPKNYVSCDFLFLKMNFKTFETELKKLIK